MWAKGAWYVLLTRSRLFVPVPIALVSTIIFPRLYYSSLGSLTNQCSSSCLPDHLLDLQGAAGWGRRTSSSHSDVFSTSSTSRAFGGLQQQRRPTASSGSYLSRSKRSGSGWEFPGLGSLRSSSGQASPSATGNGRFPRPSSVDQPPQSTFPPSNAGSSARPTSYRTGESSSAQAMKAGKSNTSDVERQGGSQDPAGSGISLEGRS
jgi:hypothetical protein